MDIFISYSSKNTDEATKICNLLESNGHKCFLAYRDIEGGALYAEELVKAIDSSDVFLLLLNAEANKSPHVLREAERACSKNLPIIVYKLEDITLSKSMEYFLMTHQWITKDKKSEGKLVYVLNEMEMRRVRQDNEETTIVERARGRKNPHKKMKILIGAACAGIIVLAIVLIVVLKNGKDDSVGNRDNLPGGTEYADDSGSSGADNDGNSGNTGTEDNTAMAANAGDKDDNVNGNALNGEAAKDDETGISAKVAVMKPGECITLGNYREEPIEWILLHKNEDGSSILISKEILCLKMFDAPESGAFGTCMDESILNGEAPLEYSYWSNSKIEKYNSSVLIQAYGNNDWSVSNIRCWLNSDNNIVKYEDSAPGNFAMYEKWPFYDVEMGFLKNFSEEEKSALSEYSYDYVNSITGAKKTLSDRVFLLSEDELEWFFESDIMPLGKIRESALDEDYEHAYDLYGESGYYFWWLRDGSENASCKSKYVSTDMNELVYEYISCYYGYGGIRPCICIK